MLEEKLEFELEKAPLLDLKIDKIEHIRFEITLQYWVGNIDDIMMTNMFAMNENLTVYRRLSF